VHSLKKLELFNSNALRSVIRQPVFLFKSVNDGVRSTSPWDPGEHIYVENVELYTLEYELLDAVGQAVSGIGFRSNEIYVHPYVVSGCSTRQWDPGVLQLFTAVCPMNLLQFLALVKVFQGSAFPRS
jgi:hypothetical protein